MAFAAGHFYFPTGGGSVSIDAGLTPQAVIFFGGNQSAEDTVLTAGGLGYFFGMAWTPIGGGIDYQTQSNGVAGVHWHQKPIHCITNGGGVDYEASSVSFTSTGFTLNVSVPASGARLVHYLVMGEFDGCNGVGVGTGSSGNFDFALGYRPLSTLMFSMFATDGARDFDNTSSNFFTLGVSNWPGYPTHDEVASWHNTATALQFRRGDAFWANSGMTESFFTSITQAVGGGPAGGFEDRWDHMVPTPTYIGTTATLGLSMFGNFSSAVFLECEGSAHGVSVPAVGGVNTYTAREYVDEVEAVLFFGTTGWNELTSPFSGHSAYVLGVLTEDYQGVVAYNSGHNMSNPSFFQSKQMCYADSLDNAGGVRAASGEIQGNQVLLTGEIATSTSLGGGNAQMWGAQIQAPSMYVMDV